MSASNEDEVGGWRHQQMDLIRHYGVNIPMRTVMALFTIVRVYLGDGTVRVEAGEKVEYMPSTSAGCPRWKNVASPPILFFGDQMLPPPPSALGGLVPGKLWYYVGDENVHHFVEQRRVDFAELERGIVVFREGLSMPKGELVRVVNAAHVVLALRGGNEYFYLNSNFVLSTSEEEAMVEWGLGRPLFANSLLAAGGTLLVCFAEQIWRPAVVGTLLVAAAGYRVQGALTKVLRVRSAAWSANLLVPSGLHRTERAVQSVLVTILALADLLDDRVLLLTALTLASVQVVVLEAVGQAVLTWGISRYRSILCKQLKVWAFVCAGMTLFVWVVYVFAGFFGLVIWGAAVLPLVSKGVSCVGELLLSCCRVEFHDILCWLASISLIGSIGVLGIWAAVEGWDEADLKFSWRSLRPWRWPLLRSTDSRSFGRARAVGLWFGAVVAYLFVGYVVVGLLSFRISSDTDAKKPRGERARARKMSGVFAHYRDERPIPSRNLLEVNSRVAAPVASVV